MEPEQLALTLAQEALDTKAQDLKILDLGERVSYTDYFIIATATSSRQAQAIADRVYMRAKKELGKLPISMEGQPEGEWTLIDYGDVVVHIFLNEARAYYGLDEMWADAPELLPSGKRIEKKPRKAVAKKKSVAVKGGKKNSKPSSKVGAKKVSKPKTKGKKA